jgi:hypothetical protein
MLLIVVILAIPAASFGAVLVSITIAPPLLPVYWQPVCPGDGYIWVPGYWAYGEYGYYWVPGTWVLAPFIGALWTPGYWGWGSGVYVWHEGYWGPHVGFYGGINYGFGYVGVGYAGGYWNNGSFYYNSAANNVNRTILHNVYSKAVINSSTMNRVSYNGGSDGTRARPTAAESLAVRDRHMAPTRVQTQLRRSASTDRAQLASVNHGRPTVLATSKPTAFTGHEAQTTSRAAQRNATIGGVYGTLNRAPGASRMTNNAHASQQPMKTSATRMTPQKAPSPGSTLRGNAAVAPPPAYRTRSNSAPRVAAPQNHALAHAVPRTNPASRNLTPPSSRYSARNSVSVRPAVPQNHSAARNNSEVRRSTSPPSHYNARNNAASRPAVPVQHAAQPHQNAPRQQTPPHSSREGGHG